MKARHSLLLPLHAAAGVFALAFFPGVCSAEKFVYLGSQPDGIEVHVQVSPPVAVADGKRQGWFRTMLKKAQPINNEYGETRQYSEMLALNVADCATRTMGAAAMVYYDDKNTIVARFEIPPKELVLLNVEHDIQIARGTAFAAAGITFTADP